MNITRRCLLGSVLAPVAASLQAQVNYPNRPVSIVVPFSPGGVADIVARALAPSLERALGKPMLIFNRPGAGGSIGVAAVTSAKPDGYTLLMALTSVSTNPEQERINERPAPFRSSRLVPLARITTDPMMLAVRPESPYRSFKALVEDAKKRPGAVSYASSGIYGVYHVATEMLANATGIRMLHVPYAGGAPALTALLSGEVDCGLVTVSVGRPYLQAGKLRPLAAMSAERWKTAPDVPTLAELGLVVDYALWSGMFAPAGTPLEVLRVLDDAIGKAAQDPAFTAVIERSGATVAYLHAAKFGAFWKQDSDRLIEAVRRIGKIS